MIRIELTAAQVHTATREAWISVTPTQAKQIWRAIAATGGRPRGETQRCPCGAMTAARAKARYHKCDVSP